MRPHLFSRFLRTLLVSLLAVVALVGGAAALPALAGAAPGVQAGSFTPSDVDFGNVPVGGSATTTARLVSTGTVPLKFRYIQPGPTGNDVILFSQSAADDLAPGASRSFNLAIEPTTLGPVDTTITLIYGDDAMERSATIHVKYTAIVPPVLPYAHFDLRIDDSFWISLINSNYALLPVGGATGSVPGPFIFPVSSGMVSPTNTGILSSNAGLDLNRRPLFGWYRLGLDLTHRHLTAVVAGVGPRVNVADLTDVYDNSDLLGRPTTDASVALTTNGAALLNATGLRPAAQAGQYIGFMSVAKR